jgi:hypothetical protein
MKLIDLVRKNIDCIPKTYEKYDELVRLLDVKNLPVNDEYYIRDLGCEGSVVMQYCVKEPLEYTERSDLELILNLEVKLDTYSYIYQLGVSDPTSAQILNAILWFGKNEFC